MARLGVRKDTGKLFFDFQWAGKRRREQTMLDDTPQNRKRAEQVLRALSVDIERGEFDYGKYFPNSRVVDQVAEQTAVRDLLRKGGNPAADAIVSSPVKRTFQK